MSMESVNLSEADYIRNEAKKEKIELSDLQVEQFLRYYHLLVEKNKVMNLTRIVDFEDAVKKHFIDSLAIVRVIDLTKVNTVLDLGTGGGFPGIPLKIAYPHLQITMLDSVGKKISFVNEVIRELELNGESDYADSIKNTKAVHARAEELAADKNYRGRYDLLVSRAVANLSTLSEYCLPFVKIGGHFISYKSGESQDEIRAAEHAIRILGGAKAVCTDYEIYDMKRTFVDIRKEKGTPGIYPRKAGTPSKQPL